MVLGTASNVGKSLLAVALCRHLRSQGRAVAPFKAVNIALNSWVTAAGEEMGMAQAQQALAAGAEPESSMNPVLIKPGAGGRAQLVVRGRMAPELDPLSPDERRARLREVIREGYEQLAARYDTLVLEGSGSTAELNLAEEDLSNLSVARMSGASCILVADIERGGVFASLLGTFALLSQADKARFVGFVINKFAGDPAYFTEGVRLLEERSGLPCLGVIPVLPGLRLKDEDLLALPHPDEGAASGQVPGVRVAVVKLPHLSNFSDFVPLLGEPGVELRYVEHPADLGDVELVVLPGSKSTLADLAWLRAEGWADT
ncbi:cobyric acid synthase, partial [Corallococcus llansteffanensis]